MLVCQCLAVTDSEVRLAIEQGASSIEDLTGMCGAGGGCGSCHINLAEALIETLGGVTLLRAS